MSLEYAKKMLPMIEIKVLVVQDQHVRYLAFGIFLSTARGQIVKPSVSQHHTAPPSLHSQGNLSLNRRASGAGMEPGAILAAMAGGFGFMMFPYQVCRASAPPVY